MVLSDWIFFFYEATIDNRYLSSLEATKKFRYNFAEINGKWNEELQGFETRKWHNGWVLNPDTLNWDAPVDPPSLTQEEIDNWKKETDSKYLPIEFTNLSFFGLRYEVLEKLKYPYFNGDILTIKKDDTSEYKIVTGEDYNLCKNIRENIKQTRKIADCLYNL